MVRLIKKYWFYLLIVLLFLLLPKIVDFLFGIYLCDLAAMNHIDASDFLDYLGSISGGLFSLIAIIVAIKQFTTEKKPIIIPRNKTFFISSKSNRIILHEKLEIDDACYSIFTPPLTITLENVTENAAIAYDLVIDYSEGKWYREICDLIGGEPSDMLKSDFEKDKFLKQGVFNSKDIKILSMSTCLEFIVKGIFYRLTEPGIGNSVLVLRYNHFIRKSYKIAELIFTTKDISGKNNTSVFDIEITLTSYILEEKTFHVIFNFVIQE